MLLFIELRQLCYSVIVDLALSKQRINTFCARKLELLFWKFNVELLTNIFNGVVSIFYNNYCLCSNKHSILFYFDCRNI